MIAVLLKTLSAATNDVSLYPVPNPYTPPQWVASANIKITGLNVVRSVLAGGIEVTATGYGFTGVQTVKVNGEQGTDCTSVTVDSDTQLRFTLPAMTSGTYSLYLEGGTFGTLLQDNAIEYDDKIYSTIEENARNYGATSAKIVSGQSLVQRNVTYNGTFTIPLLAKNTAFSSFTFDMLGLTTDLPLTGLTVTAQRSLDGAAFAACANSVSEVGHGSYSISLAVTDTNGDFVVMKFTATGAFPTIVSVPMVKFDKNVAFNNFCFVMLDNTTDLPKSGLTIVGQESINGAAFSDLTYTASEIGTSGVYKINFTAAEMNGNSIMFKFAGLGAHTTKISVVTEA